MRFLRKKITCRCQNKAVRWCVQCFLIAAALPLEHGFWEWTGLVKLLPLIGLHI